MSTSIFLIVLTVFMFFWTILLTIATISRAVQAEALKRIADMLIRAYANRK